MLHLQIFSGQSLSSEWLRFLQQCGLDFAGDIHRPGCTWANVRCFDYAGDTLTVNI